MFRIDFKIHVENFIEITANDSLHHVRCHLTKCGAAVIGRTELGHFFTVNANIFLFYVIHSVQVRTILHTLNVFRHPNHLFKNMSIFLRK